MTTHREKGIAIGIVISEAHLHSSAGVPEIAVVVERGDESILQLLKASFGGVIAGNSWRAIGRECKRVTDDVMSIAPPCRFLHDMEKWMEKHAEHFKVKRVKQDKKEGWGWLNSIGEKMF